jgi:putative chitinase
VLPGFFVIGDLMSITLQTLQKLFPHTSNLDVFLIPLNLSTIRYDINNRLRLCAFLAQTGHESAEYQHMIENLNYSREALLRVFPTHFDESNVDHYAHQPVKIANRAYANRMGNGDEASGDGWLYRGRGLIQITGKDNYSKYAQDIHKDLHATVSYMETTEGVVDSAGWFWKSRNLNYYADLDNMVEITKLINGGLNGLTNRLRLYHLAESVIV